jgi:hypothetical protein
MKKFLLLFTLVASAITASAQFTKQIEIGADEIITLWDNSTAQYSNHMEKDEVENIRWIKVKDISGYEWAFEHDKIIKYVFNKFINIPWYKKMILNLYIKYFENDIPYYT